jgi:ribosomal-protein-alanine N-acetyltransferase
LVFLARQPILQLQTERLILQPISLEAIKAALYTRPALGSLINATVPENWPNPDLLDILPFFEKELERNPNDGEWVGWFALERNTRTLIGDLGFKGRPDFSGTIELGYGLLPQFRGMGYATEAAHALLDWAFRQPKVARVVAECEVENIASSGVLRKLGMQNLGRDDTLFKWEIKLKQWLEKPLA